MRTLRPIFAIFAISALLASCSTSNDVVGGIFQKRKYNKGFYLNRGSHIPSGRSEDVAKTYKTDNQKAGDIRYSEESSSTLAARTATEKNTSSPVDYTAIRTVSAAERAAVPQQKDNSVSNSNRKEVSVIGENTSALQQRPTFSKANSLIKKQDSRTSSGASDVAVILLVILAIILPWLAVLLYEGASGRFIIVLVLWLLALFGFFLYPIAGLLMLIAVIYALLIVLGVV